MLPAVGEAIGGAGGGWAGLSMLVRFWPLPLYWPSLYLQETESPS